MRFLPLMLIVAALFAGCATRQYSRNALRAEGSAAIVVDPKITPAQSRREAIQLAEVRAKDKLLAQILKMKMSDGRSVEEAAVQDPYVEARIRDAVRAGHIATNSRVVTEKDVTLTVYMEVATIQKLLEDYPKLNR